MARKIEQCDVCQPIDNLVRQLKVKGFEVISESCRDYHFNEVEISMGNCIRCVNLGEISVNNIEYKNGIFICTCHWSTVKLV